ERSARSILHWVSLLVVPCFLCRVQALLRQRVIPSLQRIRGSRQRRDGVPLEKRIVGGEYPTIIRLAGVVTLYLIWAELRIIDASIGLRRSIAYLRVLAQVWLVRAADRVANILKLRQDVQRAMPDLLHRIRNASQSWRVVHPGAVSEY